MLLIVYDHCILDLHCPELWYAAGVMNVTHNGLGYGQASIVGLGVDVKKMTNFRDAGRFLEFGCKHLTREQTLKWMGESAVLLMAQGFTFHYARPFHKVRLVYTPTHKHVFSLTEDELHGIHAEPAKTAQVDH